jgi:hypothetical protein
MVSGSWARYAPLSGLVFAVLLVASIIVGGFDSVDSNDSVGKVVAYWAKNDSEQMASAIISAIAMVPFLWFLGVLRSRFQEAEGGSHRLASTAFAGGIALAAFALVDSSMQFATAESVGDIPPVATQTLNALYNNFFFGFPVGVGVFQLASGLVILRTGLLPSWLGWVAVVLGIVSFLGPIGFIASFVLFIWVAIVSVMLYRNQGPAAPPQTATPAL